MVLASIPLISSLCWLHSFLSSYTCNFKAVCFTVFCLSNSLRFLICSRQALLSMARFLQSESTFVLLRECKLWSSITCIWASQQLQVLQQQCMIKSFLRLRHTFLNSKYHKLKITRLPQQQFAVMVRDDTTLSQLMQTIHDQFQLTNSELLAGSAFTSDLALFPVNEQLRQANTKVKDQPFLPLMLNNDLFIYEVIKDRAHLIYGLQCLEINYTNNRNLPQKVQLGIIDLSQDWENVRTVNQALTTPPLLQSKESQIAEEAQEMQQLLTKTVAINRLVNEVKMDNSLVEFVKKISLLMSANWVFLYVITFGLYGWDVGQPVSYLTGAGVDLLALLKYFDLEQKINYQKAVNEGRWMGLLNLAAQKRHQRWLHCNLRRQYY